MTEAVFVQGNTSPAIVAQLVQESDPTTPINLTGASVRFQMRKPDDIRFTVDKPAEIIGSPANGNVSYLWGANDLANPGEYDAQWEITFGDGRIQTQARPNRILVRRR